MELETLPKTHRPCPKREQKAWLQAERTGRKAKRRVKEDQLSNGRPDSGREARGDVPRLDKSGPAASRAAVYYGGKGVAPGALTG